jgi:hypothetical protein
MHAILGTFQKHNDTNTQTFVHEFLWFKLCACVFLIEICVCVLYVQYCCVFAVQYVLRVTGTVYHRYKYSTRYGTVEHDIYKTV